MTKTVQCLDGVGGLDSGGNPIICGESPTSQTVGDLKCKVYKVQV